jgi:CDP-paratose 2-epimerase
VTVYGDGAQVRDILYVKDLVEAMQLARANASRLAGTAFNLGGGPGNAVSLLEVVELIEALGTPVRFRRAEERPGDQRYYVANTTRFARATGWHPLVNASDGIERMMSWLAEQREPERAPLRVVAI